MSQEVVTPESASAPRKPKRKEHVLGTVLLILIIFFILSSIVGIAWVGYSQYKNAQVEKSKPTIEKLAEEEPVVETSRQSANETQTGAQAEENTAPTTETKDITKEKIAVLNGGAAAGSAAKLAEALKKEGLTAVTTGSTEGDFTGTIVYYQKEKEAEAKALLALVQKEYKDAEVKEQDATKKETSTEALTIILGEVK